MNSYDQLTKEQKAFVNSEREVFLLACPGSGKTKSIASRVEALSRNLRPRRGVAVLSFTNSAVGEIKERCTKIGVSGFSTGPSIISTFDSFLINFIFKPFFDPRSSNAPQVVESWRAYGREVRLSGRKAFRGDGISLDLFDKYGSIKDPSMIKNRALRDHFQLYKDSYEASAKRQITSLHKRGIFSVSDVRIEILNILGNEEDLNHVCSILNSRFEEIIVDEAQDCNDYDIEILSLIRKTGVKVTVVCDPDQAIYSFRNSTSNNVPIREYFRTYPSNDRLLLSGNFRSSQIICNLSGALKVDKNIDSAVGKEASLEIPIHVLVYQGRAVSENVGSRFQKLLNRFGISASEAKIISHSGKDSHRAVGKKLDYSGTSKISLLANAVRLYHSSSSSSKEVVNAVKIIEKIIIEYISESKLEDIDLELMLERIESERFELRRYAVTLLDQLNPVCGSDDQSMLDWIEHARLCWDALGLPNGSGVTLKQFFRKPGKPTWVEVLNGSLGVSIMAGTIHESKGTEYSGVCVVIRPNRAPENHTQSLLNSIDVGDENEALRVFYVGVTRAQHLLAIAIHDRDSEQFTAILDREKIDYQLEIID